MEERQENKMGTMPVGKLLISMSLPVMISMLVQALYNVVDSVFVAHYSEDAITAVSLAFPIQNLLIAVGIGTGVGINSLLSRRLGEKNYEDANKTAENGIFLALISWIVFAILGALFSEIFLRMFTQTEDVVQMGTDYLRIIMIFSFGLFLQLTAERIMQSTGIVIYNMITQSLGAIINIILDPILIFGFFGMPRMGVAGAAIATVTGQIIAMILGFVFNHYKNKDVTLNLKKFKPSKRIIAEIYKVGVPSIIMQSIATVMTIGMNKILLMFTETAVSVFGIYFKLQSFIFMPVFGLTNGLIPIVAYNFGARKKSRIIHAIRDAVIYAVAIMAVGTLVFQMFPVQLLAMFNSSETMVDIGVPALRTISLSFVGAGVAIVLSSVFQAIGNGVLSLIMAITRQLVFILPLALILALVFGLNAVWYAFVIAECASMLMAVFMYRGVYRNYMIGMPDE